jgi:hypothetical protein
MSGTSYNFKDNLTIGNNKFLKWIDSTGTTRSNIITLDETNNVILNAGKANIRINSDNTTGSYTFINASNPNSTLIESKLAVGFQTTENINANITLVKNGYIGTNGDDGYLGISSSYDFDSINSSKLVLYSENSTAGNGDAKLSAGGSGAIKLYTGNDMLRFSLTDTGIAQFTPGGSTIRCSISDTNTTFDQVVRITCSDESTGSTTGALQIAGGIGIAGSCVIEGALSIKSMEGGNINFDSSQQSSSYTTGAIYLAGGLGISNSTVATSTTSGGGISVAGGVAVGKNMYIGGNVVIVDTTSAVNSQTGSLVLYGGLGINNSIWSRTDSSPQIRLCPVTNGGETSIAFIATNNFTLNDNSTWRVGQNVESSGLGDFSLYNPQAGHILFATKTGYVGINNTEPTKHLDVLGNAQISESFGAFGSENTIGNIFTKSGNVGISTTDPQTALHVNGDVTIQSTKDAESLTSASLIVNGGASIQRGLHIGGPVLMIPKGTTSERPSDALQGYIRYNSETDQFEGFGAGDNWGSLGGVIDVNQTTKIMAELYAGANDGNLRFITANNEQMRVNSSGNVAIGFTSPSYKLDVFGSVRASEGILICSTGSLEFGNGVTKESNAGKMYYGEDEIVIIGGGTSDGTRKVNVLDHLSVKTSFTTSNVIVTDSILISSTSQSAGIGSGGSFTILGGASIGKDVYVGGTITSASDIRLKKDIRELDSVLNLVDNIKTVRYKYNNTNDNVDMLGFIAQDFVEHFPELLRKPEEGYYSLDYSKITVILMKCVQELKQEIMQLKGRDTFI